MRPGRDAAARMSVSTFLYGMNEPMYTRFCAPGSTASSGASNAASRWGALGITATGRFVSFTRANSAALVSLTVATTSAAFSVSRCGT